MFLGRTPSFNATYAGTVVPPDYQFGDSTFAQYFRLTKTSTFKERYRFLVFGEMFNAFNIANLTGYSSQLDELRAKGDADLRIRQAYPTGRPLRAVDFLSPLISSGNLHPRHRQMSRRS